MKTKSKATTPYNFQMNTNSKTWGVYFADGEDFSPQSMCNIYGYNLGSCTEDHNCSTSNDTNFYCLPGNPRLKEPATIRPTGSFLCNQDEKTDTKGYIVNLVSTSEGTKYQCSNTPPPIRRDKWRCINGTCSLDENCNEDYTTCFDESTCGGNSSTPNGICDCQQGGQDVMPKDQTKDNACNWRGNHFYCIPRDASISKGGGGCITRCDNIPYKTAGHCNYDPFNHDVHGNDCGNVDNYNDCNKYMFAQFNSVESPWCDCRNYTPEQGDYDYLRNNRFNGFPIGNPDVLKETADISLRTQWYANPDPPHTDCGGEFPLDHYGKQYNLYSCVRDCPPGKKCTFIADDMLVGEPNNDNAGYFLARSGLCAIDCPHDSWLHPDPPGSGCDDSHTHEWRCRNNAIYKKHVA